MPPPSTADDTDWPAIVHEHGAAVWRLARRILDDEADAGDCFQETFVAALAASRSAPVANWPGFLRRICTARAIDLLRRRIRDRRRTAPLVDAIAVAAAGPTPADALASHELADRLRAQSEPASRERFAPRAVVASQTVAGALSAANGSRYNDAAFSVTVRNHAVPDQPLRPGRREHAAYELLTGRIVVEDVALTELYLPQTLLDFEHCSFLGVGDDRIA